MRNPSNVPQHHPEKSVAFIHSCLDDRNLSAPEFRVYCHLVRRAGNGTAFPGIDSMARVCRLSTSTVVKSVRSLEKSRLITVTKIPGKTTHYRITPKSQWLPTVSNEVTPRVNPANGTVSNQATKGNPLKTIPLRQSISHRPKVDGMLFNNEEIPEEDEFVSFMEDECPTITNHRPGIYDAWLRSNWELSGKPIHDWRKCLLGLEEKMQDSYPSAQRSRDICRQRQMLQRRIQAVAAECRFPQTEEEKVYV